MASDNRSVTVGGNITGSIIQTGDKNRATLTATQLPPRESIDIAAAVAALRTELLTLDLQDQGKLGRALDDAEEEASKPEPDKGELAGAIQRALGCASKAADFADHVSKVRDLVTQVGGWIGAASPFAGPLLAAVGLCAT